MKYLLGVSDLAFAILFAAAAFVGGLAIPDAVRRFDAEPEDLMLTILLTALAGMISAVSVLAATTIIRGKGVWDLSQRSLALWCGGGAVLLLALALFAFWSGDPSSLEMRYLWLPAIVLGMSAFVLRRRSADPMG